MNRKYLLIVSLLVIIISAALLISGSRWLLAPIMEDPYLPAGTFITWALMIANYKEQDFELWIDKVSLQ